MCHTHICSVECCFLLFLLFCCIVSIVLYLTDCFIYVPRGLDILLKLCSVQLSFLVRDKLVGGGKETRNATAVVKAIIFIFL